MGECGRGRVGGGMRGKGICIRNITADCPMCGDCDENIFLRFYFVVVVVVAAFAE